MAPLKTSVVTSYDQKTSELHDYLHHDYFNVSVVFPKFWPLDAQILNFWPQIRILRKISSPEPAGNVIVPESRLKSGQIDVQTCLLFNRIIGLTIHRDM